MEQNMKDFNKPFRVNIPCDNADEAETSRNPSNNICAKCHADQVKQSKVTDF